MGSRARSYPLRLVAGGALTAALLSAVATPALAQPSLRRPIAPEAHSIAPSAVARSSTVTAAPFTGGWIETATDTTFSQQTVTQVSATGNTDNLNLVYFESGQSSGSDLTFGIPTDLPMTTGVVYTTTDGATVGPGQGCQGGFEFNAVSPLAQEGFFTTVAIEFEETCGVIAMAGEIALNLVNDGGQGYYLYQRDGALYSFGNDSYLTYLGNLAAQTLNGPIVAMATTPDGGGYWMVGSDGGIFAFGDAGFYGSMGGLPLNKPIVGVAATPTGKGYWEVASDGGIFAFGTAKFYGSMGGMPLNKPIVGIAATPTGGATGRWPPMGASSPSATPGSTGRWGASR